MANVYATKTGNWTDTTVWNTGALPTSSDDVYANGFTVTINTSPTVLSVRTTSASGINAGGGFSVSASGYTLTADVYAGTSICITSTVGASQTFTIITQTGVCLAGSSGADAVRHNGVGTVNITGNPTGTTARAVYNNSTGTINITGNLTGGSNDSGTACQNNSTGTVNITGNLTGGTNNGWALYNAITGTVNITGNATGGTGSTAYGVNNNGNGSINITGNAVASATTPSAFNNAAGVLRVTNAIGNDFGLGSSGANNVVAVVSNVSGSLTYVQKLQFGGRGNSPTSGPIILTGSTTNTVQLALEGGGTKTLVDAAATAGVLPAIADVRSGVVYSAGNLTGTCSVPAAGSVALGVPVDATTGTAVLTASAIRTELTPELARMSNAATTQEVASIFQDAEV